MSCDRPNLCAPTPTPAAHLGGHAVGDTEGQVLQDALHAVVVLLPCGPQVLLQRPGHGGEDGLGCLSGVHHLSRRFLLLLSLETLDVDEGFLHSHHQSGKRLGTVSKAVSTAGSGDSPVRPRGPSFTAAPRPTTNFPRFCHTVSLQGMGRASEKEKQQQKWRQKSSQLGLATSTLALDLQTFAQLLE